MAINHWEPVPVNRLFNSLFDSATIPAAAARRVAPPIDLAESETHYVVRADLPGVAPEDVTVELRDGLLTISGQRLAEHASQRGGYRRIERSAGSFRRAIRVPRGIEPEAITASYEHGVLEVAVPKPEAPKAHRVPITTSAAESALDPEAETSAAPTEPTAA